MFSQFESIFRELVDMNGHHSNPTFWKRDPNFSKLCEMSSKYPDEFRSFIKQKLIDSDGLWQIFSLIKKIYNIDCPNQMCGHIYEIRNYFINKI